MPVLPQQLMALEEAYRPDLKVVCRSELEASVVVYTQVLLAQLAVMAHTLALLMLDR